MHDTSSDRALARIFLEGSRAEGEPGEGDVGAALRRLYEEGQRAWPELSLSPETFVRHLAAGGTAADGLLRVRAADLYLACACATRVPGAVDAFERAHLRHLAGFLARMGPSPAFVDEVRQVLREKLFVSREGAAPKVAEYDGRGALPSWVRVIALRVAIDLRRQDDLVEDPEDATSDDSATADPELGYVKRRYRKAFNDAFRRAAASLAAEQVELLRLHFVDGLTLDQLATKLGVHRTTVARRIAAAREAIADEARRLLRAELGASEAELESLAGVMQSQIELSLPGLLHSA
jgi:RNA polymerase sigma-70 factor (ECF subfamily)